MKHHFKKKFGQNFLTDKNIIKKIVDLTDLNKNDLVIEVGPGSGNMTEVLLSKTRVLAYEIDVELEEPLNERFRDNQDLTLMFSDFLKSDLKETLSKYKYESLYFIANLPYYITTPIITKLIEEKIDFKKIAVMVQKEVGDRMAASPGSKDYSSLTVFLNYYFNVKKEFLVSRKVFFPSPNVDSVIISFESKERELNNREEEVFLKLVRDSFKQKRKTLKNNLKDYDLNTVFEILTSKGYSETVRAEEISLKDFIEIAKKI